MLDPTPTNDLDARRNTLTQFLNPETSANERQSLRRRTKTSAHKLAYEQDYVDGLGTDQPEKFIRHTLAALYLTGGFTSRESAQLILAELRDFAVENQIDFDRLYLEISSLPGARRTKQLQRAFLLGNILLFVALIIGTVIIQRYLSDGVQIALQVGLLIGVVAGQLVLLYRRLA